MNSAISNIFNQQLLRCSLIDILIVDYPFNGGKSGNSYTPKAAGSISMTDALAEQEHRKKMAAQVEKEINAQNANAVASGEKPIENHAQVKEKALMSLL